MYPKLKECFICDSLYLMMALLHVYVIAQYQGLDSFATSFSHDTALPNPSWTVGCSIEVNTAFATIEIENDGKANTVENMENKALNLLAGEVARVPGGHTAAEIFLRRVMGRGGQSQPEEHQACLLPHGARHHPSA